MIKIGKPFVRELRDQAQLVVNININDKNHEVYYSVPLDYKDYLVDERVDAFVVAFLPLAMQENEDIQVDIETSISEKLKMQLNHLFIPTLAHFTEYHSIQVNGETNSQHLNEKQAVGSGFSAGVDSFYTVSEYSKLEEEEYRLTHLTFLNVGSHGDNGGEKARALFHERSKIAEDFAKEYDWPLIKIDSNISEVLNLYFVETHTFRSLSAILALQKLFAVYYYSSGFNLDRFKIDKSDAAYYDLLNMQMFSTEDLTFYSIDGYSSRLDKVKKIAQYTPSHNYLNVCQVSQVNCGRCEKCRRTMLGLYAANELDKYDHVFDINYFKEHKDNYLGFLLFMRRNEDYKEILENLKAEKGNLPISAHIQELGFRFKNMFRNNEKAKNIYFKYLKSK